MSRWAVLLEPGGGAYPGRCPLHCRTGDCGGWVDASQPTRVGAGTPGGAAADRLEDKGLIIQLIRHVYNSTGAGWTSGSEVRNPNNRRKHLRCSTLRRASTPPTSPLWPIRGRLCSAAPGGRSSASGRCGRDPQSLQRTFSPHHSGWPPGASRGPAPPSTEAGLQASRRPRKSLPREREVSTESGKSCTGFFNDALRFASFALVYARRCWRPEPSIDSDSCFSHGHDRVWTQPWLQ